MLAPGVFKANDIRGVVDVEWDEVGAWAIGRAYADIAPAGKIVVAKDMRLTGSRIQEGFIRGVTQGGVCVVDIGLASTDCLWFASGILDLPGVQITSSHNPGVYNGMKFCLEGAKPITAQFLRDLAQRAREIEADPPNPSGVSLGTVDTRDVLDDYVEYMLAGVDLERIRRLKVVVDAGNGMGGHTVPAVFSKINVELVGLYMDLDGTFPNHEPNPLEPENLRDAQEMVRSTGADLGLVFDGDADRVFVIDERGKTVPPSSIIAMISADALARQPGAAIVINTITSAAVREVIEELGGRAIESKVGHTYMKSLMAHHDAVFGGEHSAHYYFREFFGADTGMLAALRILSLLGYSQSGLSELVDVYARYAGSGEINLRVANQSEVMARVAHAFSKDVSLSWHDGVKIAGDRWWVSLRGSNTEPLLRLNIEAPDEQSMMSLRKRVLSLVKEE